MGFLSTHNDFQINRVPFERECFKAKRMSDEEFIEQLRQDTSLAVEKRLFLVDDNDLTNFSIKNISIKIEDYNGLFEAILQNAYYLENERPFKWFAKDIHSVLVNNENVYRYTDDIQHYQGVPYIMVTFCGDWEEELLVFVYYDNNNHLRCFIPYKGNTLNTLSMSAWGNEFPYEMFGNKPYEPNDDFDVIHKDNEKQCNEDGIPYVDYWTAFLRREIYNQYGILLSYKEIYEECSSFSPTIDVNLCISEFEKFMVVC